MMPACIDPRTLNAEELERLYYQAGLVEVAAVYARLADVQAENEEYETQIGEMYTAADYKELEGEIETLTARIDAMDAALDAAYRYVEEAKPLNRKKLLALLAVQP